MAILSACTRSTDCARRCAAKVPPWLASGAVKVCTTLAVRLRGLKSALGRLSYGEADAGQAHDHTEAQLSAVMTPKRMAPGRYFPRACSERFLSHERAGVTMSGRERLQNRHPSSTFEFQVAGLQYTCTVGCYRDGRIAELFISNHKTNSAADTAARDSAIMASIALQHGADVEVLRRALCRDGQGRASGPLGQALDFIAGDGQ